MSKLSNLLFISVFTGLMASCTQKLEPNFIKDLKFDNAQIDLTQFSQDTKVKHLENTQAYKADDNSVLRIRLETIPNEVDARKILDQKSNEIRLMFAPQQVPYMGQITKDIKCTEAIEINNKISENEKEISQIINLTATDRLIYGSCIPDQEIYKSQLLLLYCKSNKTLYEIKYFYAKDQTYKKKLAECL
jgi:hypothetical protein